MRGLVKRWSRPGPEDGRAGDVTVGGSEWALAEQTADVVTRENPVSDKPMPDIDTSMLDFEESMPDVDQSKPDVDQSMPDVDQSMPDVDGLMLEAEGSMLDVEMLDIDGLTPDVDGRLVDVEGSMLDVEGSMLEAEGSMLEAAGSMLEAAPAVEFRAAAVRLARERPQTDGATEAALAAALALLDLAAAHDEAALGQFLRPDPRVSETTWTVACYQIGDLTPCTLLDFADPLAAVNNLAACGEASHVAAELVASTPTGTRWTALTRTGKMVTFQLPDGRSASDATRERPGEVSLAGQHWRQQLNVWAANEGADPVATPVRDSARPTAAPTKAVKAPSAPRSDPAASGPDGSEVLEALTLIVQALRSVEGRSRAVEAPNGEVSNGEVSNVEVSDVEVSNGEVLRRLDALERRLDEFQAIVEVALERRIHAMETYGAELVRAFAADQNAATARLEARLDELMARIPGPLRPGFMQLPVGDDLT
jgi:hypothetical protein